MQYGVGRKSIVLHKLTGESQKTEQPWDRYQTVCKKWILTSSIYEEGAYSQGFEHCAKCFQEG